MKNKRQYVQDLFCEWLQAEGFRKKGPGRLIGEDVDGTVNIYFRIPSPSSGALEIFFGKKYDAMEDLLVKYAQVIYPTHIPFKETLRFSENTLEGRATSSS